MSIRLIVLGVAVGVYALYRTYPAFGGRTPKSKKEVSENFINGKFVNQIPTSMKMRVRDTASTLKKQMQSSPDRRPALALTPERLDISSISTAREPSVTWFGHSAFLLQINNKTILLDPMFGRSASPFPIFGPKRFSNPLPADPEDLPHIDAVLISHDHYDHLDYPSIKKLSSKVTMFFVPLGIAAHLERWGVPTERITEIDWWQESIFEDITFICTPSRHFSGRTLTDRFATLWCSWTIIAEHTRVFFSGDSGYGPHFKQIGDAYGPFDLTLLECGQYDPLWPEVHMDPEQTAAAHMDLRGTRMIPMHWGAFVLALHDWTEPVERVLAAGANMGATIMTPRIGEVVAYHSKQYPTERWWKKYVTQN